MSFLEDLAAPGTLRTAWQDVAAKNGAPGIDRVAIADLAPEIERHLERLAEEIQGGRYRPLPVLRIRPPFLEASDRALVVPTVRDRIVQRAIANLLTPEIDPLLSPACRAFRKGHSAREAADDVGRWVEEGLAWVLRADVRSFFDSIRPEILRQKLEPFVDEEGLRFLDRILRRRVFDHQQVTELVVGIAQGSPLSPLLGNLYLHEVDQALAETYPHYLRYCDDLIVMARDEAAVRGAHERVEERLRALELELRPRQDPDLPGRRRLHLSRLPLRRRRPGPGHQGRRGAPYALGRAGGRGAAAASGRPASTSSPVRTGASWTSGSRAARGSMPWRRSTGPATDPSCRSTGRSARRTGRSTCAVSKPWGFPSSVRATRCCSASSTSTSPARRGTRSRVSGRSFSSAPWGPPSGSVTRSSAAGAGAYSS